MSFAALGACGPLAALSTNVPSGQRLYTISHPKFYIFDMALKIYISHTSGSMEIKRKQDFVYQLLNGRSITYELVDIADPQLGEEKQFMRDNAKPEDGQKVPMPPQIFSNNQYIGDYDAIHHANEVDEVYEFLGIHQPKTANSASVEINQPEPTLIATPPKHANGESVCQTGNNNFTTSTQITLS